MLTFNHLENFILNIAPLHYPCKEAPNTFEELKQVNKDKVLLLPVFSGGCANTIWSNPKVNHALRAWHDDIHLEYDYDFSLYGEISTARKHIEVLRKNHLGVFSNLFWCEIVGQVLYYNKHKKYVSNQREFVLLLLCHGVKVGDIGVINNILDNIGEV